MGGPREKPKKKKKKKKVTTNTENEWIGGCQGCRVGVQQNE